jgi:hypothetical protein
MVHPFDKSHLPDCQICVGLEKITIQSTGYGCKCDCHIGSTMANKYRKKPVVIEAIQFDGYNHREIYEWSEGNVSSCKPWKENYGWLKMETLEGTMEAGEGDWIIKGIKGEFYTCKPDIFQATYELVV